MNPIPIHILQERTSHGVQVRYMKKNEIKEGGSARDAHRDDHYIFFLVEDGLGSLMIDFKEISLQSKTLFYVLPGQVHHIRERTENDDACGWFIAVDTGLVPQACRNIFEGQLQLQQPYQLSELEYEQFRSLLILVLQKYQEDEAATFYLKILHSLLEALITLIAGCYQPIIAAPSEASRSAQLTGEFKKLLNDQIRFVKSPAEYAYMLNISESYLSEALKKQTGFPASYWIKQEVIMEARRLLYYSNLSIKEIAHHLGYDDHSYFSRLFKKATGSSAVAFRDYYRK